MKKRGPSVKDFLRAESIDELVSSEEKQLFRTQRFLSRPRRPYRVEEKQPKLKKASNIASKVKYFSLRIKRDSYQPLKYKPIIYIPLKARNMFRISYRRRFKRGRVRRNISYYTTNRHRRRMRERINTANRSAGERKRYLESILQREPKMLAMPQYKSEERQGYWNKSSYQKAA